MGAAIDFFATCPRDVEAPLADELRALGATAVEPRRAGVAFSGTLETGYRACLWSRVANRILLPIGRFPAADETALYDGVRTIHWQDHLGPEQTLSVGFTQLRSQLDHEQYGALKTKDAIVDQLRDETGTRPSIDTARPDVRVHVHVEDDQATVSIDLAGESLHRRGWRHGAALAPLKENLAAAILLLAGWPERARAGAPLYDPMCGAGTLLVEGAFIAADRAPGLTRDYFGFLGWRGHDARLWTPLLAEAREREIRDPKRLPIIRGFDEDTKVVHTALENIEHAGLRGRVHVERRALDALEPIGDGPGVLVTNPPYGERLGEGSRPSPAPGGVLKGDVESLGRLYQTLGDLLRRKLPGWTAFVLSGNPDLAKRIGLKPARRHVLHNGPIECRLLEIPISTVPVRDEAGPGWRKTPKPSAAAEMFANRLAKNLKHLKKWARREEVHCFRVYDADLPEYSVAVDLYEDAAHVQEYECPPTVDPQAAEQRLHDVMAVTPGILGVAPEQVYLKVRRRQRGLEQYEKLEASGELKEVREGGHRFLVNLRDYIDTGLFLDDRRVRALIGELAPGVRFLNLFAYTGTATVYAAKSGARATLSVDLSNTYLDWAQRNLSLNGIRGDHRFERADILEWLPRQKEQWGLIFLAPPTFSRSKSMSADFDVQRDHVPLLQAAADRLTQNGVMLFETNFRRFKMDTAALPGLRIEDITKKTLPEDFQRNPRIHNTFRITGGSR